MLKIRFIQSNIRGDRNTCKREYTFQYLIMKLFSFVDFQQKAGKKKKPSVIISIVMIPGHRYRSHQTSARSYQAAHANTQLPQTKYRLDREFIAWKMQKSGLNPEDLRLFQFEPKYLF